MEGGTRTRERDESSEEGMAGVGIPALPLSHPGNSSVVGCLEEHRRQTWSARNTGEVLGDRVLEK